MVSAEQGTNEDSFYWQHKSGKIAFRAVYKKDARMIVGFNALGMRLRHALCDAWLQEGRTIDYVMENLDDLNLRHHLQKQSVYLHFLRTTLSTFPSRSKSPYALSMPNFFAT